MKYKAELNTSDKLWINNILNVVPTYKRPHTFSFLKGVAENLPNNSNILVVGAGQGAEVLAFDKWADQPNIWATDLWQQSFIGRPYLNINTIENTLENFNKTCSDFCSRLPHILKVDIENISQWFPLLQGPWDLVYYDSLDGDDINEYPSIEKIFEVLWSTIKSGGIFMGDDYYYNDPNKKLTRVVNTFAQKNSRDLILDPSTTPPVSPHWIIKKD